MIKVRQFVVMFSFLVIFLCAVQSPVSAQPAVAIPKVGVNISTAQDPKEVASSIQILLTLTVLSLAPSILIMMTAFTRIIMVLYFIRSALGTQQMPPNQVLIGLALFLTLFIMGPIFTEVNTQALQPYTQNKITQEQAIEKGMKPFRSFMIKNTRKKDVSLFVSLAKIPKDQASNIDKIPSRVIIPAFIISELKTAFMIGFIIYIPFIIIDMVVSSVLMAMGMMMLPPAIISLPFKILLFIMIDGWNLLIGQLVRTFK